MKKRLLFALGMALSGVMTSCMKDFDMFEHPIHVDGTVDPHLGIPVAYGELNMNDILSSLSSDYSGYFNPDSLVMTIEYDTLVSDTIYASSMMPLPPLPPSPPSPGAKGAKSDTTWWTKDTVIVDTLEYDFFNNVNSLDGINVAHVWMDLDVGLYGDCPSTVSRYLSAHFDSLQIYYVDHENNLRRFVSPALDTLSVDITDIRTGFRESFRRVDIASILNDRPKKIIAKYRFQFNVSKALVDENINNLLMGQVVGLDSLQMTKLVYSAEMKLQMPMQVRVDDMNYTFDVTLGNGLSSVNLDSIAHMIDQGINVDILDTKLRLNVENYIPLKLVLSAVMMDANGAPLCTVFFNEMIPPANTSPVPGDPTVEYSTSPSMKQLVKQFTASEIDLLAQAKKIRVNLLVGSNSKHVQIRKDDKLKIKAYLQVHPSVSFDVEVLENGLLK